MKTVFVDITILKKLEVWTLRDLQADRVQGGTFQAVLLAYLYSVHHSTQFGTWHFSNNYSGRAS